MNNGNSGVEANYISLIEWPASFEGAPYLATSAVYSLQTLHFLARADAGMYTRQESRKRRFRAGTVLVAVLAVWSTSGSPAGLVAPGCRVNSCMLVAGPQHKPYHSLEMCFEWFTPFNWFSALIERRLAIGPMTQRQKILVSFLAGVNCWSRCVVIVKIEILNESCETVSQEIDCISGCL